LTFAAGLLLLSPVIARAGTEPEPLPLSPAAPVVAAALTAEPIHLDGRLDEAAWQTAGVIAALTQAEPTPGAPTPYKTELRLLTDGRTLYLGVRCFDPEPGRLAVHTLQRDGDMSGDDKIDIVLDSYGDDRTGYVFKVNAAGARKDGLIGGPGDVSYDWDGIWDARVTRDEDGWTAEIAIPAATLRFKQGLTHWGLNVERQVAREHLQLRWSGIGHDYSAYDLSRAGGLTGLENFKQGRGLTIAPYGVIGADHEYAPDHRWLKGAAGLDVSFNLTPELLGVLTLNTDFAETEVDSRVVNLSRFPVFFPEKRAFFVEGQNYFSFNAPFVPFYSRRIGAFDGGIAPIDAGLKLIGRMGKLQVGLLDVRTRDSAAAPGTNLFAGRAVYDLTEHLHLGAIATHGDPDGIHDNSLGGFDLQYSTSKFHGDRNFNAGLWLAQASGDLPPGGSRGGGGFHIEYPNDRWFFTTGVDALGGALNPALGFIDRPGTVHSQIGLGFQPRPKGEQAWARQFFFEGFANHYATLGGVTESWRIFLAPLNVETRSGDHYEANFIPQYERLFEPFEIADGVVIPPGEYRFNRARLQAESSGSRPFRAGVTYYSGGFYDGRLRQLMLSGGWTSRRGRMQLSLDTEHDFGNLPGGNFTTRLYQFNSVFAFSVSKILTANLQYDSESRNLGANVRLRWTIKPGSDLFIVWNRGWEKSPGASAGQFAPQADQLLVKMRWTFRL
jgi:hypothetical protein